MKLCSTILNFVIINLNLLLFIEAKVANLSKKYNKTRRIDSVSTDQPYSTNNNSSNMSIYDYFSIQLGYNIDENNIKYYVSQNLTYCDELICPNKTSLCLNSNICQCRKGFANIITQSTESKNNNLTLCNYTQKRQLIAFLLEFFLGFGSGHFYVSFYSRAVPKLIICIIVWTLGCFIKHLAKKENPGAIFKIFFLTFCIICSGYFFWVIADLIMYGINGYNDGNYMPLASW